MTERFILAGGCKWSNMMNLIGLMVVSCSMLHELGRSEESEAEDSKQIARAFSDEGASMVSCTWLDRRFSDLIQLLSARIGAVQTGYRCPAGGSA
jgi:hypothetical protein